MGRSRAGQAPNSSESDHPGATVAEMMRTDFRSCNASDPAPEVATAMRVSGSFFLPVTRAQVPIGIVTEHDLAMALAEHGGDLSSLTAGDLMSSRAPTVPVEAPIQEALDRLASGGGCLLAVDTTGMLQGILTLNELRPWVSEAALTRLVAQLDEGLEPMAKSGASVPRSQVEEPTSSAEIKSSKSQAQPHPWDSPTKAHPEPVPLLSPADLVNPMLTVGETMTPNPRTCSPVSTVLEAALIFRDADCGVVPIVEEGRPVGALTDRDVALAVPQHESDLASRPVEELMTRDVATISADADLGTAIERLGDHGLRRLMAVDSSGSLVGVLSWTDLVPHLSERGLGHVVGQIVGHR